MAGKHLGEHPGAAAPRYRAQTRVVEAQELGLVHGPLEPPPGEDVGEVDERPGRRCDGNPLDDAAVPGGDLGAVDEYVLGPAIAGCSDLEERGARAQSQKLGGTAMAEDRSITAGEHRCHQPPIAG